MTKQPASPIQAIAIPATAGPIKRPVLAIIDVTATARAPRSTTLYRARAVPPSARSTTSGWSTATSESKSPSSPSAQALSRELYEETGIRVDRAHRLAVVNHDYPGRQIRLDAWMVDAWSGEPAGREGQTLEWVPVTGLDTRDFPAANARILKLIELPPLCLITPDLERYEAGFLRQVRDMIDNGLRLIQFRSRKSSRDAHAGAVRELVSMCEGTSCSLLYNGEPEEALMLGAHGVHLRGSALARLKSRPLPADKWVAASCHNREELRHAAAIGDIVARLPPSV